MSKERQIEEMAADLCLIDRCKHLPQKECHMTTCAHCEAEALYNAGYRKLPCEIGDRVYCIRNYNGIPTARSGTVWEMYYNTDMTLSIVVKGIGRGQWGIKIFATREECEQAIKEKESKKV